MFPTTPASGTSRFSGGAEASLPAARARGLGVASRRGLRPSKRASVAEACDPPAGSSGLPGEMVESSLERPLIGLFNQTSPHRIIANIVPFFAIAFVAAQLRVPTVTLPEELQVGQLSAGHSFPIRRPLRNVFRFAAHRRTKQMNMIGHDDVAPHLPLARQCPNIK